jgi:hypothetical protein
MQGFAVDSTLVGETRSFDSVRVRVEARSRIAQLIISTGDYEIDLASTQDRSMFARFGLDHRPLHAYDVTLDVAQFMNDQFTTPATYPLSVSVTDRAGVTATATLSVTIVADEPSDFAAADSLTAPQQLRESAITLTRQAAAMVTPVDGSPLTWTTREPVDVTIRLRPADPGSEIRQLDPESWDWILTRDGLERKVSALPPIPYVDVPAARNGAAGTVLAISGDDGDAMIRITTSSTSLSELGTTVTLAAVSRE